MTILVTGAAGFIGYHVARALLARGESVIGIDNLNAYYDPRLKQDRLAELGRLKAGAFRFVRGRISPITRRSSGALGDVDVDRIVHLGAQAGVRYSIDNPRAYVSANLAGHLNLLELARHRARPPSRLCLLLLGLWQQRDACRSGSRTGSIIRSRSMPPPRRRTS